MMGNVLRALWAEPRPPHPPARAWWDWALVGVLLPVALIEGMLRDDLVWRPVALILGVVVVLTLWWRSTHPLLAVVVAFGLTAAVHITAAGTGIDAERATLWTGACLLLLPYSLLRWGSGHQAAIGLPIFVAFPLLSAAVTHPSAGVLEGLVGIGFFLFSATLGAAVRYGTHARLRDIEQAKLRQRNQLARELHDTVGHHVSAIAIQAQAGRALAASDPDRALATLETIEEAASRALKEMRAMVGVLRNGAEPDFAPQPGVGDIAQLAHHVEGPPRVDVELSGDLDDVSPPVGVALYRIAGEAVNNAVRHARHATRILVHVADEGEQVRLTVRDDGDGSAAGHTSSGYGLVGMAERASLLGGTLRAGPDPGGGWTIDAVLPKAGAAT